MLTSTEYDYTIQKKKSYFGYIIENNSLVSVVRYANIFNIYVDMKTNSISMTLYSI